MFLRNLNVAKPKKFYLVLFFWAFLIVGGFIFLRLNFTNENITQTLKIEKVYAEDSIPGSGVACSRDAVYNNSDCQSGEICYLTQYVSCAQASECSSCGDGNSSNYACQPFSALGNICWGRRDVLSQMYPCGRCGTIPGGGGGGTWTPSQCNTLLNQVTTSYKFSIYNPAGVEKAYITAEGYLKIFGNGNFNDGAAWLDLSINELEEFISNNNSVNYCQATAAGIFKIHNNQGRPIAAFIACNNNSNLTFMSAGHFEEFVLGDYSGSNNFVIKNFPFDDQTSAWLSNDGILHLKGCYAND